MEVLQAKGKTVRTNAQQKGIKLCKGQPNDEELSQLSQISHVTVRSKPLKLGKRKNVDTNKENIPSHNERKFCFAKHTRNESMCSPIKMLDIDWSHLPEPNQPE